MQRTIPTSWLHTKYTREELEAENMTHREDLWPAPIPFGFLNDKWQQLLALQQPGDELWTYSSSRDSWANLCGRAGVALVRNGVVVAQFMTSMN
jgi:hypothetical protein